VRAVFFLLLFANLAFLGWAEWVDVPQPAPANDVYAKLPRLRLISEQPGDDNRASSGSARKTALQPPPQAPRCLSIGPFDDQPSATRGASALREKGLTPRQRAAQGEISKGYWVYIGGLKSDREVGEVLRTLEQSHIEDAHLMPDAGDAHRVSVGLFSERDRADRRAQAIQKLGLQPEVAERKLPTTVFWMDVDLPPGTTSLTAEDVAGEGASSHVEVMPCPNEVLPPDGAPPLHTAPRTTTTFRTKVATGAGASNVP
jgi:hypothetical protein